MAAKMGIDWKRNRVQGFLMQSPAALVSREPYRWSTVSGGKFMILRKIVEGSVKFMKLQLDKPYFKNGVSYFSLRARIVATSISH